MKLNVSLLLALPVIALVGSANASFELPSTIDATSQIGKQLLNQARRLDGTDAAAEFSDAWVAGYSLVFQGCHHISQWNDEADGEDDVRIVTKRLVRFRLCPSDSCSSSTACSSNYGDYIVDMNTYMESWFEAKKAYQSFKCEYLDTYVCPCDNEDNEANFDAEKCKWDCYSQHNMAGVCMQTNPYTDDAVSKTVLDVETYMQCAVFQKNNVPYYIGPYCSSQGGAIFFGMFTEDSCTNFVDNTGGRQTYYELTGDDLPYGNSNLIDMDCLSCKEPSVNNVDGDDTDDADNVSEVCESLYTQAGKCEQSVSSGVIAYPNNNACNYMQGIKIVRKDGTVVTAGQKANRTASIFIGIFVVSFLIMAAYSFYLKSLLDRASIMLSE